VPVRGQQPFGGHVRVRAAAVGFDHIDRVLEILLGDLPLHGEPVGEIPKQARNPFDFLGRSTNGDLVATRYEFNGELAFHDPEIMVVLSEQ
jgi:hypothetical protein